MSELSIFNIQDKQAELNSAMFAERGESPLFNPKVKNVGDSQSFIIRVMPYINDIPKSLVSKAFYVFNDSLGTIIFDSRTTFNQPEIQKYEFCEASDLWSKLRNSPDPAVSGLQTQLRLQRKNYAYVLVMNNPADPKFNGRIMPMEIPMEMVKLMRIMTNPTDSDKALGAKSINPFDLYNGCAFRCTITGHKPNPNDPVMRDWKVEREVSGPAIFPLGEGGAWMPIGSLEQAKVAEFFTAQQTFNMLEMYDNANGSFLIDTLLNYYMCGFNVQKTAQMMYVHRNSLQYRLKKIEEILEISLDDSMEYLDVVNCILVKRLMFN
jgi:hypothetical protein